MNQMYTYKFRLKPTPEQEVLLAKHFGCCRFVYNHFLEQRKTVYRETKKSQSYIDNQNELPQLKTQFEWLKEVGSQTIQYAVRQLQNAYDSFFEKISGFPRFKSKYKKDSFRSSQNVKIIENKVIIPKFLDGIEYIPDPRVIDGKIEFATISRNKAGQYHIAITCTRDIQELPKNNKAIGIDLNKKDIVDSNGVHYLNPNPTKKYKSRTRFLQKALSRTKKTIDLIDSNGRKWARQKLALLGQHIHNIREDFLHKLSRRIVNENQVICVEDLSVKSMLTNVPADKRKQYRWEEKRHHREMADIGCCSFRTKLQYKSEWAGRNFVKVDRWYPSSQICNKCGHRYHDLPNNCKEWFCWNCWEHNQRDDNAALNIRDEGYKVFRGTENQAGCPDIRPALSGL